MSFARALRLEAGGDFAAACSAYEETLAAGGRDIDGYINLLVLYWQMSEYGFSAANGLDRRLVAGAGERRSAMLRQPPGWVSETAPYRFWSRYIRWADFGEPFEVEECIDWLKKVPGYSEPAFFVFSASAGRRFGDEAAALSWRIQSDPTIRAKYVRSVIESVRRVDPAR